MPGIQERLHGPGDDEGAPSPKWEWENAEKRLEAAYEEGGLSQWGKQAFAEMEAERRELRSTDINETER